MSLSRTKRCPACEQEHPLARFGRNRQAKDGLHYYCKDCAAARQRAWARANPAKVQAMRSSYLDRIREINDERDPYELSPLSQ